MLVFLNECEKVFDRVDLGVGLVAVPLKVSPLPEDLPISFALVVSRLGDGVLQNLAFVVLLGADFEDLDALPMRPEREIKLGANMHWRAPAFDELGDERLAPLLFEFAERHDELAPNLYGFQCPLVVWFRAATP